MEEICFEILDDKYFILSKLGEGATSKVYLVEEKETRNKFAAKIMDSSRKLDEIFSKEVFILKEVKSPNIISIKGYGYGAVVRKIYDFKQKNYLLLELASKGDLFDFVSFPKKGFGEKDGRFIFKKILFAVQSLHNKGISHRDLKMENILIDEDYNIKLSDFGYAKSFKEGDYEHLLDSSEVGTNLYKAPEIIEGRPYNGRKVDIFSLGVLLFTLVTCKKCFVECASVDDEAYKFITSYEYEKYWARLGKIGNGLSHEFKDLFLKMISFIPSERPEIGEIIEHPWMKLMTPLEKEVKEEFQRRELIVQRCKNAINDFY